MTKEKDEDEDGDENGVGFDNIILEAYYPILLKWKSEIDFVNVPRRDELSGDIKIDVTKIPIVKNLSEDKLEVLKDFFNNNNLGNTAYANFVDEVFILGTVIGDLLIGRFIDGRLIDWFSVHLKKKCPNIVYFKVYAATFIDNGSKTNLQGFVDDKIKTNLGNYTKLFFPIFANSHFTLLEFQKKDRSWIHYDSIKPKNWKGDEHVRIARKVRIYVSSLLKKLEEKQHVASSLLMMANSPQQESSSVDCGLFVMNIMRDRSFNQKVHGQRDLYTPKFMLELRAELAYRILSDDTFSWNSKFNETQECSENVLPEKKTDKYI